MVEYPDCGSERVETMEEFWRNPSCSCPVEAALAERDRRIAELQGERDRFRLQVEQ